MAKISSEKIFLQNVGEWTKIVSYSKGLFRIALPDIICRDLVLPENEQELTASTEEAVNKLCINMLLDWEHASTQTKKVIVFKATFQGGLLRDEKMKDGYIPHYGWSGYGGDYSFHHFCEKQIESFNPASLGLLIQWAVYSKQTFKTNSKYRFDSGRPFENVSWRGVLTADLTEIDWTDERQNFFLDLDETFARMIAKVFSALGEMTSDKLLLLIASGMRAIMLPAAK